ncbi:hypothetical protein J6X15_00890 [Candidatus Saccharibacteria bacterium]|nr:hypothetical protein [Candidatus Saccharibacteria bacterium]MBP5656125.1 hypothetical protein [Candidatus Saccharibacteria bacterium]
MENQERTKPVTPDVPTTPATPEEHPSSESSSLEWEDFTVSSNGFYDSSKQLPDMVGSDSVKFIPAKSEPHPEDFEDIEDA